jgi:hypothetical protein
MTIKQRRHTNRVLRVLIKAAAALEKLAIEAKETDTYPITTQKAFAETLNVFVRTKARVITGNAEIV